MSAADLAPHIAAAFLLVLLAGWILVIKFTSRLHQLFALFLVLRAVVVIANPLGNHYDATDPELGAFWHRIAAIYLIPLGPALAAVVLRVIMQRVPRWVDWSLLGGTLALVAWGMVDQCSIVCGTDEEVWGPLGLVSFSWPAVATMAALAVFASRRGAETSANTSSGRLVAWGLLISAGVHLGTGATPLAYGDEAVRAAFGPGPWGIGGLLVYLASVPAYVAAVWLGARADSSGWARAILAGCSAASLVAGIIGLVEAVERGTFAITTVASGLAALAFPITGFIAFSWHRLAALGDRMRQTMQGTSLAATFIAVFFVIGEGTQSAFSSWFGPFLGLIVAGLIIFALAPLQLYAERISKGKKADTPSERLSIFREQATLLWIDGHLTARERIVLEQLRTRLGISAEQAAEVERGILRTHPNV